MNKVKCLTIFIMMIVISVIIPNNSNAATKYTYEDTEQGIIWEYEINDDETITLKGTTTDITGTVEIPDTIEGKNVTTIGGNAFRDCKELETVTIPNTVTNIGYGAFYGCGNLANITLSEGLVQIEQHAFTGCCFEQVKLPNGLTTIEEDAFFNVKELKKILIPDSVTSIGNMAFYGCDDLVIYGNDGMTSKTYAEEKGIAFDYIANWDESSSGEDITPPAVELIEVKLSSLSNCPKDENTKTYMVPTGTELTINTIFSEDLVGTTAPKLVVKFGEGNDIELTNGAVSGSKVTYTYTVKSGDLGTMAVVSLSGGDLQDEAGNDADLTWPELTVEYDVIKKHSVYANGTAVEDDDSDKEVEDEEDKTTTDNDDKKEESTSNKGTSSNGSSSSKDTNKESSSSGNKDKTTAPGKLPQTGLGIGLAISIVAVIAFGGIAYSKYSKLKGL